MSDPTALVKRPADGALMPPPPPPKRIKRPPKVLDEDTYTSALSHIIARDFFPGLLETESQQDYLNALDAGDEEWIEEAEKRVRQVLSTPRHARGRRGVSMTPRSILGGETPKNWKGDTPMSTRGGQATPAMSSDDREGSEKQIQGEEVDLNLSLTAFQAKYTSEDNESFNKVIDKQNAKHAAKYSWMHDGNKLPSARQIAQAAREQKLLQQRQQSSNADEKAIVLSSDAPRPSQDQDLRPASIDQIRAEPRNNLMFTPTDVSETHPHHVSVAQAAQDASRAAPKSVSYASTRLLTSLHDASVSTDPNDPSIPPSPSVSAIDAAIHGHPYHHPTSTAASSSTGSETPRVQGYAFVDADPTPSELGHTPSISSKHRDRDRAALLTQLIESSKDSNSTDAAAAATNPFTIHSSSRREALHHRIVDKQLQAKRNAAPSDGGGAASHTATPTPKFPSSPRVTRSGGMTPAAQRLYAKVGRTPARGGAFDGGAAAAGDGARGPGTGWTPTPLRVRKPA